MYQEMGEGAHTVHELMARSGMWSRQFLEGLRGIWPMLEEEYISAEREHEGRPGSSRFGGGIVC